MAASTLWAKQVWIAGSRQAEVPIPRNAIAAEILFDRSSLTGTQLPDAMWLDAWISQNNGTTWTYVGGAGFPDGSYAGKCGMRVDIPNPNSNTRKAKVEFRTGRSVNVAVTVETFT